METVLSIGIQASVKKTLYRQHCFETHLRLSLDMLNTRHRERLLVEACAAVKQPFVLDNTNVLRQERAEYIQRARAGRFRVVGYFFEPQVDRALAWNQRRGGAAAILAQGRLGTLKRLERPRLGEGFDDLYRGQIDQTRESGVEVWNPLP